MSDYKEYIVRVYYDRTQWRNKEGQLHREDGPAVEWSDGTKSWYQYEKRHREDGPAVEYANGDKCWYKNGLQHREDGPAVEWASGDKYWYQNGKLHREDGPAIECANRHKAWYINGKQLTEQEFNNRNKKEFSMDEIAAALGVPVGELKIKKD